MKIITNKQMQSIIELLAANQIITLDALNRASAAGAISVQCRTDSVEHLFDNSIEVARIIGGLKGIKLLNKIVTDYKKTNNYEI